MPPRVTKGEGPSAPPKPAPKVSFTKQLQQLPQPKRAGRQGPSLLERNHRASAAFDAKLEARRSEAEQVRPEHRRLAQHLAELILAPAPRVPDRRPAAAAPLVLDATAAPPPALPPPAPPATAVPLAARLEALIVRAERLLHAEGPALELELDAGAASSIEVVRTAKGEVAVVLAARSGRERAALHGKLEAIRAALHQAGLQVKRVSLAR